MAGEGKYVPGGIGSGTGLDAYMQPAQKSLQDMINLFRQGGGYGAGQNALIDEAANRSQAEAASNQVASGMSSGSLATSTGQRIKRDAATAKLGVEDTRTNFLAQAMKTLSDMFTQFGGMNSQERMQAEALKKQSAIADMNAAVNLMGNRPQSRPVMPGFESNNFWGTPATDSQGRNQPDYGFQGSDYGKPTASAAPVDYTGYQYMSGKGGGWQPYGPAQWTPEDYTMGEAW